ncbi:MAG: hypothetical protein J3K34DRAFT_497953 [Monoraphidium minutum]|nr:MAG: hypothetical protein J3K34DRAFT_497953 [Monoraphidium minutum]
MIAVSPPVVELRDVEAGGAGGAPRSVVLRVKNLDGSSHSVRVRPPAARRFSVRGLPHTERLAPGIQVAFEVLFDVRAMEPGVDYFDKLTVSSDAGDAIEVPLRALAPKPRLRLLNAAAATAAAAPGAAGAAGAAAPLLEFGVVPAGSSQARRLRLVNEGSRAADWKAAIDGGLPLKLDPASGRLEAGGAVELLATLSVSEPCTLSGELLVSMAWSRSGGGVGGGGERGGAPGAASDGGGGDAAGGGAQWDKEPVVRCPVGASVVACAYELRSDSGGALKAVDFGAAYFGERSQRSVLLYNGGPSEARFDLSFGPASELGPADGTGPGGGGGGGDAHANFLRAKAREEADAAVRVWPLAGSIPAYGTARLAVAFQPPPGGRAKGFHAQAPEEDEAARAFDYVVQVDMSGPAGARPLRFAVRGRGLLPRLLPSPRLLHFGGVASGGWADQLVSLTNGCGELPLRVEADSGSPYFKVDPPALTLDAGQTGSVAVRYLPKALGNHTAAVSFLAAASGGGAGAAAPLAREVVEAAGSCQGARERAVHLPGGPEAIPETFTKQRHFVDEAEAALWTLKAEQGQLPGGYERPKLWQTPANAQALEWIGPEDAYGVTKDVQVWRRQHADEYTGFIRAGRTAKAREHLTRPEGGEGDADMGLKPYRGLSPPRVRLPKGPDPLWTAKPEREGGPAAAAKAPPAAALAALPIFKDKPEGEEVGGFEVERAACTMELTPAELASLQVAPRTVDFGKVSTAAPGAAFFVVTNALRRPLHVALDLGRLPELAGSGPLAQVVPGGATAKFPLALRCHEVRTIRERCEFCINGAHFAPLEVAAEVVPVTLRLSSDELNFAFGIDNWESHVDQSVLMTNPHNFAVDYLWEVGGAAFTVSPPSGTIKPKSTAEAAVRWRPAAAPVPAAAPAGKGVAGLMQTAVMTLRLKGGADVPQRVSLVGELPGSCLKLRDKEVALGPVPVGEPRTAVVTLRNAGSREAAFRAVANPRVSVHPDRARVPPEGAVQVEVSVAAEGPGPWAAVLELEVRGGRPIKIPIRAEGVVPCVLVREPCLAFPPTFVGGAARLPLTLANEAAVPATLVCDLTSLPDFELLLTRDAWASADYESCPIQKIGANGEMSALGSKRVSRRMSSADARRPRHRPGESGYRFVIHLRPSSTLAMALLHRPSRTGDLAFTLPLVLHSALAAAAGAGAKRGAARGARSEHEGSGGEGSDGEEGEEEGGGGGGGLAVEVTGAGVQPQLVLSKGAVDFGACVIGRGGGGHRPSPYAAEVYVRNNTEGDIQVSFGVPSSEKQPGCLGVFVLEPPGPFVLAPEEGAGVTLRFTPRDARPYEATIPIFIHGDTSAPHLVLELAGVGRFPRLTFETTEVVLPAVPLGVVSRAVFHVVNDGYDNLELRVRLPADESCLPLKVELPEGNLIGLARERLPVAVSFSSGRPTCFTAAVEFLDEEGRCFSQAVTGTADNCTLTTQPFLEANAGRLALQVPRCGPPLLPAEAAEGLEMPEDDALGPLRCSPAWSRYLSAATCRPWPSDLRKALVGSRGKLLLELIEAVSGRAVAVKAAPKAPPGGGAKADASRQQLALLGAALAHLRSHGALVNAVKPELLLDGAAFDAVVEARAAAAAGDAAAEEALEAWVADAEARFDELSARSWGAVLLQIFRVYVLARVTPQLLRALPGMEAASPAAAALAARTAAAAAAAALAGAGKPRAASGSSVATSAAPRASTAAGSRARSPAPGTAAAGGGAQQVAAAPAELGPGDIPGDEALCGSNVFGTAEACLLAWLNVHVARMFPERVGAVANFDADLSDGAALFACLAAAWPRLLPRRASLRPRPAGAQEARQNAELVVKCMEDLSLPFELSATDLLSPAPGELLPLVLYLFQTLPQLAPRSTVREVELTNPGCRMMSYTARLEGHADFGLEASSVRVEPGGTARVSVRCHPSTSIPRDALLVLQPRRDAGAPAAPAVFALRSAVRTSAPLRRVEVAGPLYEMAAFEVHVVNPFPQDCDFTLTVLHEPPEDADGAAAAQPPPGRGKGARGTSGGIKPPAPPPPGGKPAAAGAAAAAAAPVFADPFGVDRPRLRLRAGAGEKLKGSFLPFAPGPSRATLLLRDAECGEFCYELYGAAGPPAAAMEHKAVVAHGGGQQFVDVPLPFANAQLEAARRTYLEKHPLGRDKDQAARLRQDAGRLLPPPPPGGGGAAPGAAAPADGAASGAAAAAAAAAAKPERALDYAVSCSSAFVAAPAALTLRSGADAPAADKAQQGGGAAAKKPAAAGGGGGAGGRAGPPPNTLRLSLKPVGAGLYPALVTLTSGYDVRVVSVEVSAQSLGQAYTLELECPARQQASQDIPIVNTGDAGLSAQATLVTTAAPGGGDKVPQAFSGPREVSAAPGGAASYALSFRPPAPGTYSGRLELFFPSTGERNVYSLVGRAGEPLEEGRLLVECQARCPVQRRLQVPNLAGALPLAYSVMCDLDCLEGPDTLACASARSPENYKFIVCPSRSGTFMGMLSFVAPDGNYAWFGIEVRASPPPEAGELAVTCPARRAVAIRIPVTNPGDRPLALRATYLCASLVGPVRAAIPPGSGDEGGGGGGVFECYYAPLAEGREEGVVRLVSDDAGEVWWRVHMTATPGGIEELPLLPCPFGGAAAAPLTVTNPLGAEAAYTAAVAAAEDDAAGGGGGGGGGEAHFSVSPAAFKLGPYASADLTVTYRPGSLGVEERATVVVDSAAAGRAAYAVAGKGLMPGEGGGGEGGSGGAAATEVVATLGKPATQVLSWPNPLTGPATVRVLLSSPGEAPGVFSVALKAPPQPAAGALGGRAGEGGPQTLGRSPSQSAARRRRSTAEQRGGGAGLLSGDEPVTAVVPGGGALQLPVSFCPAVLREAEAQLSVGLLEPAVAAPGPLVWRYGLRGVAQVDTRGVSFSLKCKARQRAEIEVWLPLPGLPPPDAAAPGPAPAGGAAAAPAFRLEFDAAAAQGLPGDAAAVAAARAALATSLRAELLAAAPAPPSGAAPGGGGAADLLAGAPQLRARLVFEPRRALAATVPLAVVRAGGGRWAYDVTVAAAAPDVDGVITLEAHMGRTAEAPLMLRAAGAGPEGFSAEFTPESPLAFDVRPARGVLPPAAAGGDAGGGGGGGVAGGGGAAPITVLYTCREMGRVLKGRLVVHTDSGQQYAFDVRGRMPAYVPPDPKALTSTLDTGRASGGGGGGQQRPQQRAAATAGARGEGAGAGRRPSGAR